LEAIDSFHPVRPRGLSLERIVLAKGSVATPARKRFVDAICALYPEAAVVEAPGLPHNKIAFGETPWDGARQAKGKRTLVFGVHQSAVRFSEEADNACPNYWHHSPTGYCFYGCSYCFLAGTPGVWHSPSIKIYVNINEIMSQIDLVARRLAAPTAFHVGKLQDALSLDPLTGYSERLVPFFARHPYARQIALTKTAEVDRLLPLEHRANTIVSWSLNPQKIIDLFEEQTPSLTERLAAMQRCAARGYPVRAEVMPLIPIPDWQAEYQSFIGRLLAAAPIRRLTLGGVCSYPKARRLLEQKLGRRNAISANLANGASADGRLRYPPALRIAMYSHIIQITKELRPELPIALCLEEKPIWEAVGLEANIGRCNCAL